jgi:hypothetical protein
MVIDIGVINDLSGLAKAIKPTRLLGYVLILKLSRRHEIVTIENYNKKQYLSCVTFFRLRLLIISQYICNDGISKFSGETNHNNLTNLSCCR